MFNSLFQVLGIDEEAASGGRGAMMAGAVYGYRGLVRELIAKLKDEAGVI